MSSFDPTEVLRGLHRMRRHTELWGRVAMCGVDNPDQEIHGRYADQDWKEVCDALAWIKSLESAYPNPDPELFESWGESFYGA